MHLHAITIEQFAKIHKSLEVFGRVEEGWVLTMIGKHPALGVCVMMTDFESHPTLLSEIPLKAPPSTEPWTVIRSTRLH